MNLLPNYIPCTHSLDIAFHLRESVSSCYQPHNREWNERRLAMTKIHLDTDIGGDMDDVCALAMLLKWPDLEITGVTTVSDDQGETGRLYALRSEPDGT